MPGHDSAHGHRGHHPEAGQGEAAAKCSVCAACCASMAIAVAGFSLAVDRPVRILRFAHRRRGLPLRHRRAGATSPNFLLRLTPRARSDRLRPVAAPWRETTRASALTRPPAICTNEGVPMSSLAARPGASRPGVALTKLLASPIAIALAAGLLTAPGASGQAAEAPAAPAAAASGAAHQHDMSSIPGTTCRRTTSRRPRPRRQAGTPRRT